MKNVGVVWKKEMMDAMRDQRTMFFMVVFPLVLYPLLMFGIGRMARTQEKELRSSALVITVGNASAAPELVAELSALPHAQVVPSDHPADDVRARRAQAAVAIPADAPARLAEGRKIQVALYSDDSREVSRHARTVVEDALNVYSQHAVARALKERGLPPDLAQLVSVRRQDVTPPNRQGALLLATFLPYFLVIAVANGSVTTAIDTTAGEKDRGTLETVLVTSSRRSDILVGKLLAVVSTGFVATLSSAAGLAGTFLFGGLVFSSAEKAGAAAGFHVALPELLAVLLLTLPIAVLLSALLMALGCFAKSAREGQMMSVSLQMAVIFGGLSSMFQQTEPQMKAFLTPVLGTALVQKEILRGELNPSHLALAVISSIVLAGVAIAIAARLFGNERLMFRAK